MIPEELIKRIRQIQIYTSRAVDASFAGQYESVFKGRGMQFDEVREYMPGDDIRTIDWNVTARTGKPFIKRFVEEREMTVLFAVDLSASGEFGTVEKMKNELAAEFCAVLAFAAAKNNDKVGLLIFTDRIELFIPPKKGSRHVLRLIRELLAFKMPKRKTDIPQALDYIARVIRKRATVFLVSDFIESDFKKPLSLLNRRHDVVAVPVRDRVEIAMPSVHAGRYLERSIPQPVRRPQLAPLRRADRHVPVDQRGFHPGHDGPAVHKRYDSVFPHAAPTPLTRADAEQN